VERLLPTLLSRGDSVSIVQGRICIVPASGRAPPEEWLKTHSEPLVLELLMAVGQDAYQYDSRSTGRYGLPKAQGVTLQFRSLLNGSPAYVIFNAELNYVRGKKKGKPLPRGQFRVRERSHFYKFWLSTGLKMPDRRSRFHDYLGNLKTVVFTGKLTDQRFDAGQIRPLEITEGQVKAAFLPHNSHTTSTLAPHNSHTSLPHKDSPQTLCTKGLQPDSTTGLSNYGNKVIRDKETRDSSTPISNPISPSDQTVDEWLEDYGDI
jgi:hypothetical protein